jgi:hypothetical protein
MLVEMHQSGYKAYTLRLSPTGPPGVWRVTLYSAQTGERWRFANLEEFCAFLSRAVADASACSDQPAKLESPDQAGD